MPVVVGESCRALQSAAERCRALQRPESAQESAESGGLGRKRRTAEVTVLVKGLPVK